MKLLFWLLLLYFALAPQHLFAAPVPSVRHDLRLVLQPGAHRLEVTDTVSLPEGAPTEVEFLLHGGLAPQALTEGTQLKRLGGREGPVPLEAYALTLPPGRREVVLRYGGVLHHPLEGYGQEYARGFRQTPGVISEEGVYLSGSSAWVPDFGGDRLFFSLEVEMPPGWRSVSQGGRARRGESGQAAVERWEAGTPQEEVFVIAGPFVEYDAPAGRIAAIVFLRSPDEGLASRYLEATESYLTMYEGLIGPYPYPKFALVENFWETGFGMPSFTLLGPKVIRFPFILHSSYPHEILHNWWGNGVYPDYGRGNWSEGLTAYLADHLIKEQRGQGAEHRRAALQKYADFVHSGRDFPLTAFRSRHSSSSEAIGYGKAMMFFHMLRRRMGDDAFRGALRDFYKENLFRAASYDDLERAFAKSAGEPMGRAFGQWVDRAGAPALRLRDVKAEASKGGYRVSGVLEQVQEGDPYALQVPVAVTLAGRERAFETTLSLDGREAPFALDLPARPLRLDVDPRFDLFRRLDRREIPPALSLAFGAQRMLVVLPSAAKGEKGAAYRQLAVALAQSGPDEVTVATDASIEALPSDRAVLLLGWENALLPELRSALQGYDADLSSESLRIGTTTLPRENHSLALAARNPGNPEAALLWVAGEPATAFAGLGRKLPHYHKYGYLAFEGEVPTNVLKGSWPVLVSPLIVHFPGEGGAETRVPIGLLSERKPLADLPRSSSGGGAKRGMGDAR